MSPRRCEECGRAMIAREHRQQNTKGRKVCRNCLNLNTPEWSMTYANRRTATIHLVPVGDTAPLCGADLSTKGPNVPGAEEGCLDCTSQARTGQSYFGVSDLQPWGGTLAAHKVAHDSGDGADLAHCPFCGSGGIVGSPDGTVECQFCHKFFTVQVQPEFKNMPQTIDGQPYNIPGMPGGGPDAGAAADAGADAAGDAQSGDDPTPPDQPDDKQVKDESANPFVEGALLVTAEGVALEPEAYLAHLALAHADDREMVLAQVRLANSRRSAAVPQSTQKRIALTDLLAERDSMQEVLDSGRHSDSPDDPIEVTARPDLPGKYEIADGHHRVAEAIRAGRTSVMADVWPIPDDEPLEPPFFDFARSRG